MGTCADNEAATLKAAKIGGSDGRREQKWNCLSPLTPQAEANSPTDHTARLASSSFKAPFGATRRQARSIWSAKSRLVMPLSRILVQPCSAH